MKPLPTSCPDHPRHLWAIVAVGILAISCASILVRLADAPSLSIATYRVTLASLLLAPLASWKRKPLSGKIPRTVIRLTILSGICLALHFAAWISSLQMTSIASSTTLVSTSPLFVALFSYFVLGEPLSTRAWLGISLVLGGSLAIAGIDLNLENDALTGDLLALVGALAVSGYLLAGRIVRRHLELTSYTFGTYGTAALTLLLLSLFTGAPLSGFSTETYGILILLAVVPQLIGHTAFNWTLRFLSPTSVAVLILGEPIGASILAYLFLGENISLQKGISLFFLGTGIALTSVTTTNDSQREQAR
jgi:drug/metabolite transporter (DMT)-like permease